MPIHLDLNLVCAAIVPPLPPADLYTLCVGINQRKEIVRAAESSWRLKKAIHNHRGGLKRDPERRMEEKTNRPLFVSATKQPMLLLHE